MKELLRNILFSEKVHFEIVLSIDLEKNTPNALLFEKSQFSWKLIKKNHRERCVSRTL